MCGHGLDTDSADSVPETDVLVLASGRDDLARRVERDRERALRMSRERPDELARLEVPRAQDLVIARRDDVVLPSWPPADAIDIAPVTGKHTAALPVVRCPDSYRAVAGARGNERLGWRRRTVPQPRRVALQHMVSRAVHRREDAQRRVAIVSFEELL